MKRFLIIICIKFLLIFSVNGLNILKTDLEKFEANLRKQSLDTALAQKKYIKSLTLYNIFDLFREDTDSLSEMHRNIEVLRMDNQIDRVWVSYLKHGKLDFFFKINHDSSAFGIVSHYFKENKVNVNGLIYVTKQKIIFIKQFENKSKAVYLLTSFLFPYKKYQLSKGNKLIYITTFSPDETSDKWVWKESYSIPSENRIIRNLKDLENGVKLSAPTFSLMGKTYESPRFVFPWMQSQ